MYRLNHDITTPEYDALSDIIEFNDIVDSIDGDSLIVRNIWKGEGGYFENSNNLICSYRDVARIVVDYNPDDYPNLNDKAFIKECEEYLQELNNKN